MKIYPRRWILAVIACLFLIPTVAGASETAGKIEIQYLKDKLTVNIENAALGPVLDEIRNKTGLDYMLVSEDLARVKVSAAFHDTGLEQGLKKILGRVNHAIVYGPNKKMVKVAVFGIDKKTYSSPSEAKESPAPEEVTAQAQNPPQPIKPPIPLTPSDNQTQDPPPGMDPTAAQPSDAPMIMELPKPGDDTNPPMAFELPKPTDSDAPPMIIEPPSGPGMIIEPPSGEPMVIITPDGRRIELKEGQPIELFPSKPTKQ